MIQPYTGQVRSNDWESVRPKRKRKCRSGLPLESSERWVYEKKAVLFFDFDCNFARHLYGTIKVGNDAWRNSTRRFPRVWRFTSDKKTLKDEFDLHFGGVNVFDTFVSFSIRFETNSYAFIHHHVRERRRGGVDAESSGTRDISQNSSSNGIWSEGAGFMTPVVENAKTIETRLDWGKTLFQNILPNLTWFVDDSCANYDDGNGPGATCGGGKTL